MAHTPTWLQVSIHPSVAEERRAHVTIHACTGWGEHVKRRRIVSLWMVGWPDAPEHEESQEEQIIRALGELLLASLSGSGTPVGGSRW